MGPVVKNTSKTPHQDSKRLWKWLFVPSLAIQDESDKQLAYVISAFVLTALIILSALLVTMSGWPSFEGEKPANIFAIAVFLMFIAYTLSRTRYYYLASILSLLTLSGLAFGKLLIYETYENTGTTLMWLILPLILATKVCKLRDQAWLTGIDLIGLVLLAILGPQSIHRTLLVIAGLVFSSSGVLIYIRIYERHIENAQLSKLTKYCQALEHVRTSLENQLAECTRNADVFRTDAEAANGALEMQMWQVTGLAELSKSMRDMQTLPALTTSIVKHVCRYADIPVGALFIAEGNQLRLAGSYAYPFPTNPSPRFQFGSGLVGEAALNQQVVTLRDIPENYLPISSGLGEVAPTQILALPCIYQERVVGVLELAALEPFSAGQIQFLTTVMESIASALHTAQIRNQIDTLLVETQQQAEELRVQEEEQLRVTVELEEREASIKRIEQLLQKQKLECNTTAVEPRVNPTTSEVEMETSDDV